MRRCASVSTTSKKSGAVSHGGDSWTTAPTSDAQLAAVSASLRATSKSSRSGPLNRIRWISGRPQRSSHGFLGIVCNPWELRTDRLLSAPPAFPVGNHPSNWGLNIRQRCVVAVIDFVTTPRNRGLNIFSRPKAEILGALNEFQRRFCSGRCAHFRDEFKNTLDIAITFFDAAVVDCKFIDQLAGVVDRQTASLILVIPFQPALQLFLMQPSDRGIDRQSFRHLTLSQNCARGIAAAFGVAAPNSYSIW